MTKYVVAPKASAKDKRPNKSNLKRFSLESARSGANLAKNQRSTELERVQFSEQMLDESDRLTKRRLERLKTKSKAKKAS